MNSIKFLVYVLSIVSVSLWSDDKGNTGVLVFRSMVSASSAAETTTTTETTASDDGAIELTPTPFERNCKRNHPTRSISQSFTPRGADIANRWRKIGTLWQRR